MKEKVLNSWMNIIKEHKNFDEVKLAEIKYGLEGIYLTFSKLIIISIIALILGIFKEMVVFMVIYNVMRMPSFGLHAKKSWMCLLSSTITFIGVPLLSKYIVINNTIKFIIGAISVILICVFSPADTEKRPIVNKRRRQVYKMLSTIIATIYIALAVVIENSFISNCFLFATILQNVLISPITYKIFKLPYNNYKTYIAKYGLN
ncbi:MAG: accessory gene regulator AgrB [Bacilli bacterium]|nr:accessory gene regulator AgrB [Bacilli bacterium]